MQVRTRPVKRSVAAFILFIIPCAFLISQTDRRGLEVVARKIAGESAVVGRQIAVIIAVNKYREWNPLKNPVKDAKELKAILEQRYYIDEFDELYDENATKAEIFRLLSRITTTTRPEDSVMIYYAGHGCLEEVSNTAFWIPVDGGKDTLVQDNWIPASQIRGYLSNMKARHVALISDSCFSGDILDTLRGAAPVINDEYYRNAYARVSRQVLTSGASETVSDDSSFSRQLKLALEGNTAACIDPLSLFSQIRLGVKGSTPLFGSLKDSGHQEGAAFLLFLKGSGGAAASAPEAGGAAASSAAAFTAPSGFADLMVSATEAGAEILVDGVSYGNSPTLAKKLAAGRTLSVMARTATMAGTAEVTLSPGELREISVTLSPLLGNLFVTANESAVELWIDGADKGPLGSGVFKGIPAGSRKLELKGSDLYGSAAVAVKPGETAEVKAVVRPVGKLEVSAPEGARIQVAGRDFSTTLSGSGRIENVPAGAYSVSAGGNGFLDTNTTLTVQKGQAASWTPYSGGTIRFDVVPEEASCLIDGNPGGKAGDLISGVAPGQLNVVIRAAGYHEASIQVSVSTGRVSVVTCRLELLSPAIVSFPDFAVGLVLSGAVLSPASGSTERGKASYRVPAGIAVKVFLASPYAESINAAAVEGTFAEGENRSLSIPSGRITLPWIPAGAVISIGSANKLVLKSEGDSGFRSQLLPAGMYMLSVGGPQPFSGRVVVNQDAASEPEGYRSTMTSSLAAERLSMEKKISAKRGQDAFGWVSLVTGLVGAAGAGVSYYLGSQAMVAYRSVPDTAGAMAARAMVDLYSILLPVSASVGGVGLGLAPVLWIIGPDPKALQASINSFDSAIQTLGK